MIITTIIMIIIIIYISTAIYLSILKMGNRTMEIAAKKELSYNKTRVL